MNDPVTLGRRNRRKGRRKQRDAFIQLGLWQPGVPSPSHEEQLAGPVRVEVKAGKQVQAVANRWEKLGGVPHIGFTDNDLWVVSTVGVSNGVYVVDKVPRPFYTFFARTRTQSDRARRVGDSRPFVAVAMPDGYSTGIAVLDDPMLLGELWRPD